MYYFYDATYILVIIGAIISLIASMNVKSTFNRYDKYNSRSGLTGAMAAQEILRAAGITNVRIERVSGNLTDHYSPKEGVLRLSDSVYNSTSTNPNQFCLEIILCRIRGAFDYLIYPYYPAYMG